MKDGSHHTPGMSQPNLQSMHPPRHPHAERALRDLADDPATSKALRAYLKAAEHRDVADLLNELEAIHPLFKAKFEQLTGTEK